MTRQQGFSLLELLVALVLLGLVATLGYAGLKQGMNYWRSAQQLSDRQQASRVVRELLRRQLAAAVPTPVDRAATAQPRFRGEPEALEFVAPLMAAGTQGGLYRLRLYTAAARPGEAERLMLAYRPLQPTLRGGEPPSAEAELLQQVGGLELSYYGAQLAQGAPHWQRRWHSRERLPALIRLRLPGDPLLAELAVRLPQGEGAL